MPLKKGKSKKVISLNNSELIRIALEKARRGRGKK